MFHPHLDQACGVECPGCVAGQDFCRTPCWGTPKDISTLLDLGVGSQLMLDVFVDEDLKIVELLSPAERGHESLQVAFCGSGERGKDACTFQASERICSVHFAKPVEGRVSCCRSSFNQMLPRRLRADIAQSWNTQEGRALVDVWKVKHLRRPPIEGVHLQAALASRMIEALALIRLRHSSLEISSPPAA